MADAQEVVTPTVEPETPTATIEAPIETPSTTEETPFFSQEELDAILNPKDTTKETPTEPVLFEEKKEDAPDDTTVLLESLDQMVEELNKKDESEEATLAKLTEIEKAKAELEDEIKGVEELFDKVQSVIWPEVAQAMALWDMDKVPLHYVPENWKRLESHPVLWPLATSVLKWETIDVPGFLKSLSESRRASMPNIEKATVPEPVIEKKVSPLKQALSTPSY